MSFKLSNLSEIQINENNKLDIPSHILEDSELNEDKDYAIKDIPYITKKRIKATWDCNLENVQNIPIVPFKIFGNCRKKNKVQISSLQVQKFIENSCNELKTSCFFIKTCEFSSKDVRIPIFDNEENVAEKVFKELKSSNRTNNYEERHLIIKVVRNFMIEARCYIYKDKLCVIISKGDLAEYKESILDFYKKYKFDIPYHCCCMEIGINDKSKNSNFPEIEVIEFNSLGPDLICDISPLSWDQDWELFLLNEKPIFIDNLL
jgi:hypothetical protein